MAERKASPQPLPGVSPTLEFGRLMPRKRLSILVCTWNMAEGRFLPDNVNRMLFPAPDLHSNAKLKEMFLPDVFVVSTQVETIVDLLIFLCKMKCYGSRKCDLLPRVLWSHFGRQFW